MAEGPSSARLIARLQASTIREQYRQIGRLHTYVDRLSDENVRLRQRNSDLGADLNAEATEREALRQERDEMINAHARACLEADQLIRECDQLRRDRRRAWIVLLIRAMDLPPDAAGLIRGPLW